MAVPRRKVRSKINSSLPILLHLSLAATAFAQSTALPKVDFARMGKVGIAGSFAGLDFFNSSSPSASTQFDPSTSTLLSRASDGSLSPIGSTGTGGRVLAACTLNNKLYIAGAFDSIGGTTAHNAASYDPSAQTFSPLGGSGGGLDGEADAVHCDSGSGTVWYGGKFHAPLNPANPTSFGGAVALYNVKGDSWSPAPFVGLTGAGASVLSISPSSSGSSLYFSGNFLTAFTANTSTPLNGTNNPSVPFSAGATPFSSSLVPIPLGNASINASPASDSADFDNINNILCPSGPDGPGQTWLAADGSAPLIIVRAFQSIVASGLRLGNTAVEGRGTASFSLTSIPDNAVLTLTYTDPVTNTTSTCSDQCPLLTNTTIPYQDFLFDASRSMTGFQLELNSWVGAGPGLHLMQLLSNGAFASSIGSQNQGSCFSPAPSSVNLTGTWNQVQANTDIAGTIQQVLVAQVAAGTTPAPSLTWTPYVSASGQYNVSITVPGCLDFQDCDSRTSVKVTVSPGGGLPPVATTVSQQVDNDAQVLVYSGPIVPVAPSFTCTVTMTLADQPTGTGSNGQFDIVADRVLLQLTSTSLNGSANATIGGLFGANAQQGFGLFEWPLSTSAGSINATTVQPNSTETALDTASFQFFSAIGAAAVGSTNFAVRAVVPDNNNNLYIGGAFILPNGAVNVAVLNGKTLGPLANQGLNAPVTAMAFDSGNLYVGGSFTDLAGQSGNAFRGVARYNIASNSWNALQGGLDGPVTDLIVSNGYLSVTGSFTKALVSSTDGPNAAGLATWDLKAGHWVNSGGFLVGSMTLVAPGSNNVEYVAGNVVASARFGADGWAILENGNHGQPALQPVNASLDSTPPTVAAVTGARRSVSWFPRLSSLMSRQSSATLAPLPAPPVALAPAVLAGTFWTNTSTSKEVIILGGNFTFSAVGSSGLSQGVAIYNEADETFKALGGNQINGVVRTLAVTGDTLFIGGNFTMPGVSGSGLATYDLAKKQWQTDIGQGLQNANGGAVVIRSLSMAPAIANTLLVAGSFTGAGSLPCVAICAWNIPTRQWSSLGSGVRGEVASVDYANGGLVVVGGSLTLADGTPANVAMYSSSNSTWTAIGSGADIPGPVTAIAVDNLNSSSIFAAGRSADGSAPFFLHWNGIGWTSMGNTLQGNTAVTSLEMVPLQDDHSTNGVIESDRMLMVTGLLASSSWTVSSALFDGQTFYPYITSATSSGLPGFISTLFHSFANFSFTRQHFLATGVVILISIAIAAGIVFFLLLIGVLWTLYSRRSEGLANPNPEEEDDSLHRPSSLLEHINAATRATVLGAGAEKAYETNQGDTSHMQTEAEHDGSGWHRAETPLDAAGLAGSTLDGEEQGRSARARYSFDGAGEGELQLVAGTELTVLDDRDAAWWYVRDAEGREGVVPAAYLY
ncbi:hypothetical protein BOTBODRAFT_99589 [Botryobasidium botryosum FD-172 SS1]|uniref:SH3 domain-containing protein n=1 Tax=Botryobasidium botryosum (strain FD-172 SS1) TaxID=930990 RepID=A0A067ND18_BOTB1|nr:hypothetical protein BOTBODRAFT_99589 [Botryobasidium botryosum FD-172 SS1]